MRADFIQTDGGLVARSTIAHVDDSQLETEGFITIRHHDGDTSRASAIQAFEALMLLKPSALEGKRFRYGTGAWVIHNLIAHPAMQLVALGGMALKGRVPKASSRLYELAIAIHDMTVPMPKDGRLWSHQKRVTLVVTGSVAAIKAPALVQALRDKGLGVDVVLTKAAEAYGWAEVQALQDAGAGQVLTEASATSLKNEITGRSDLVLVAPASADFIAQLTHEPKSGLAAAVKKRLQELGPVAIAPAMNYRMWQHAAVQRNCTDLSQNGVHLLGPVEGPMACGDYGVGRMLDAASIADSVTAILKGEPALKLTAVAAQPQEAVPRRPDEPQKILAVLAGRRPAAAELLALDSILAAKGCNTTYVIDESLDGIDELKAMLPGHTIVTDHYQLSDLKGMEHIRLPETADQVVFPFANDRLLGNLIEGRADSLAGCIYLASKAPVAVMGPLLTDQRRDRLEEDGTSIICDIDEFVPAKRQAAFKPDSVVRIA